MLVQWGAYSRYVNPQGVRVYRDRENGQRWAGYARAQAMFFSPFESGFKTSGWRWYWRFLRQYPEMDRRVEADCYAALGYDGLVMA